MTTFGSDGDVPDRRAVASAEERERDKIGEILVHQARYMIFDNCKLYPLLLASPSIFIKRAPKIRWRHSDLRRIVPMVKYRYTAFSSVLVLFVPWFI